MVGKSEVARRTDQGRSTARHERTPAPPMIDLRQWLQNFRRLVVRPERPPRIFSRLLYLASALILLRIYEWVLGLLGNSGFLVDSSDTSRYSSYFNVHTVISKIVIFVWHRYAKRGRIFSKFLIALMSHPVLE